MVFWALTAGPGGEVHGQALVRADPEGRARRVREDAEAGQAGHVRRLEASPSGGDRAEGRRRAPFRVSRTIPAMSDGTSRADRGLRRGLEPPGSRRAVRVPRRRHRVREPHRRRAGRGRRGGAGAHRRHLRALAVAALPRPAALRGRRTSPSASGRRPRRATTARRSSGTAWTSSRSATARSRARTSTRPRTRRASSARPGTSRRSAARRRGRRSPRPCRPPRRRRA